MVTKINFPVLDEHDPQYQEKVVNKALDMFLEAINHLELQSEAVSFTDFWQFREKWHILTSYNRINQISWKWAYLSEQDFGSFWHGLIRLTEQLKGYDQLKYHNQFLV